MEPTPPAPELLDGSVLDRLHRLGGAVLVDRMIELFLANGRARVDTARASAERGDRDGVERAAHSLKTIAANVGALRLQRAAQELERAAEAGAEVQALVAGLQRAFGEAADRLQAESRSREAAEQRPAAGGRRRIAIVEDNPDNRLLVQAILEGRYDLVEYEDGPTALAGLPRDRPDLLLLDISLPGMDGEQVLHAVRQSETLRGVPAIALTAHAMAGDRERFLAAGFDDYVAKPIVDEELLLDAIARHLHE